MAEDSPLIMPDGSPFPEGRTGSYFISDTDRFRPALVGQLTELIRRRAKQLSHQGQFTTHVFEVFDGPKAGFYLNWEFSEVKPDYVLCAEAGCVTEIYMLDTQWRHNIPDGVIMGHDARPLINEVDGSYYETEGSSPRMATQGFVSESFMEIATGKRVLGVTNTRFGKDSIETSVSEMPVKEELKDADKLIDMCLKNAPLIPETGEVRMTNATTGAQKGAKDAKYNLIPVGALEELAKLYGFGATKYAPRNWEKGYEFSLSYDALQRHANQWWGGENVDKETQLSHLASVAWHAFTLMTLLQTHPEMDDRPKKEQE